MKSFKLILINALTLVIGLGLLSGSFSQHNAQAARFETIPAMQITELGNYRGHYLTVLYAVGSRPFISTDPSQITLSQVKEARTVYIAEDKLTLPSVQVAKEGFRPAYNIVVFVVSPQPNYSWLNSDGNAPQGMTITSNHESSLTTSINKSEIAAFVNVEGQGATMTIPLSK